jgi:hypothetical protein
MRYALANHNTGVRRADGMTWNVGICWDADRLQLSRVGIEPDDAFLTTAAGRTDLRQSSPGESGAARTRVERRGGTVVLRVELPLAALTTPD